MEKQFADTIRFVNGQFIVIGKKQKRSYYDPPWWLRWSPSVGKPYKRAFHKIKRVADRQELIGRYSGVHAMGRCKWQTD